MKSGGPMMSEICLAVSLGRPEPTGLPRSGVRAEPRTPLPVRVAVDQPDHCPVGRFPPARGARPIHGQRDHTSAFPQVEGAHLNAFRSRVRRFETCRGRISELLSEFLTETALITGRACDLRKRERDHQPLPIRHGKSLPVEP